MKKNYMVRNTGYLGLVEAIMEICYEDAKKTDSEGNYTADALDAQKAISEWKNLYADIR